MNSDNERVFEGVWIDKDIWLDKRLSALEKVIYVEIRSLDNEKHCTAGNEYLAEFCGCSIRKITNAISKLIELGYIEKLGFDGKIRTLCVADSQKVPSRIEKSARQTGKKCQADWQKVPTNNIYNNITNNISNKYIVEYDEIISYLNEKADTHYKSNNKQTMKHINARLNEGFTVDDFKTVIDKKCSEWLGTEYEKYLRPDTLFAGKFESYLNQLGNIKSETNEINEKTEELKLKNYQLNETLKVMQHNLDIGNVSDVKEHKFQMEWINDAIERNNNLIQKLKER